MTTKSSEKGAITQSRMSLSGYVGHVTTLAERLHAV